MPAGRVAAQEEMSVELVRKVAVVPLEEMRPCCPEEDIRLGGSDTEAGVVAGIPINTDFVKKSSKYNFLATFMGSLPPNYIYKLIDFDSQ